MVRRIIFTICFLLFATPVFAVEAENNRSWMWVNQAPILNVKCFFGTGAFTEYKLTTATVEIKTEGATSFMVESNEGVYFFPSSYCILEAK